MEYSKFASENFYYCPGCKKFHEYSNYNHDGVNRKLCFFCGKIKSKKTKIIGNHESGYSQVCDSCNKEHGLEIMLRDSFYYKS